MHLSRHAQLLLGDRYLLPGERPEDLFRRVAATLDPDNPTDFRYVMENLLFLPNSPTLMNAGTPDGQLSACFVLPVADNLESIFSTLTHMALIHQSGGGTGFSFSHIRPRGDQVNGMAGVASGPVSFIRVFDAATDAIRQGGKRRGANMGVLASSHPDIREFITCKQQGGLCNFNLSVGFDARFFHCLDRGNDYPLVNPRNGEMWDEVRPADLLQLICGAAWATGDPGVLFLDEINRHNTLPRFDVFEATNPCGEQPLFSNESCNLGSINLARCVRQHDLDEELLRYAVHTGVNFLDAVIDANHFPLTEIAERTLQTRKIGLGVMGFAEMLIRLGIPYESREALEIADRTMAFIQQEARTTSAGLGEKKGSFPAIESSIFQGPMRNATVTTIAPTGSLHIIADTSSGIEPLFSLAYHRRLAGTSVDVVNRLFAEAVESIPAKNRILTAVREQGMLQDLPVDEETRELFRTAPEIAPEHHVRMQAVFQRHVDNAVSKTVNMPEDATVEDVCSIYRLARACGCKGITIYRYRSRQDQVLTRGCQVCSMER
jgi:ribonucleoside-diphosphate reductase alpha chain